MGESSDFGGRAQAARARALFIGVGMGLAMGLAVAGWTWFHLASTARTAAVDCEKRVSAIGGTRDTLASDLAAVRDELATEVARGDVHKVRILLARAIAQVDQANFGTTGVLIDRAVALLRTLEADASGIDPDVLADVLQNLEQMRIHVSVDPASQRAPLTAESERLDGALDL